MNISMKILITVIAISALTLVGCSEQESKQEYVPKVENIIEIESEITSFVITKLQFQNAGIKLGYLREGELSQSIKASGEIAVLPQDYAKASTYIGGVVKEILVQEGDFVKKGQRILILEHPDYVKLQQEYIASKNKLDYLKKEYDRQKELLENKAGSGKVFQQAESLYNAEISNVSALQNELSMLSISIKSLDAGKISRTISLRSPIQGYVGEINTSLGTYAEPNIALFDVTNVNNLIVHIDIFEKDVLKVAKGQKIQINLPNQGGEVIEGEISSIGKTVNRKTNTVSLRAKIKDENTRLIPGMFVNVKMGISDKKSKIIKEDAVIRSGSKQYVFIANEDLCTNPELGNVSLSINSPKTDMSQDSIPLSYEMVEVKTSTAVDGYVGVISKKDISEDVLVVEGAYYLMSQLKSGETVGCCAADEIKTKE